MEPTPIRYCPIHDRGHLPLGVVASLPSYRAQFAWVAVIRTNLCASCAYGQIACDPLVCERKLVAALPFITQARTPIPALAGTAKAVYRDYMQEKTTLAEKETLSYRRFTQGLLD